MNLPSWQPLRETTPTAPRRSVDGCSVSWGVIQGVAHGGPVPDIEHAESTRWLRALFMGSRLLRFPSRPVHRGQEALAREFHLRLLVADRWGQGAFVRGGGRAGKHLQPPLVPFRRLHGAQGRSVGDFVTAVLR